MCVCVVRVRACMCVCAYVHACASVCVRAPNVAIAIVCIGLFGHVSRALGCRSQLLRLPQQIVQAVFWLDAKTMVADGLTNGGVDRRVFHLLAEKCHFKCKHEAKKFTTKRSSPPPQPPASGQTLQRRTMHRPTSRYVCPEPDSSSDEEINPIFLQSLV